MARFQDISLAFDDIIETPLTRRRKVEEASLLAQQRMAQAGGPFAALAGGIAGSLPGITENIRTTARDAGLSAFQLPGEKLADQLKNINTNTEAGQRQAVALIERIDPGRAEMLREHYREKNAAIAEAELKERIFNFEQQQARNDLAQKAIENRQEQQMIALRTAELAEEVKQNGIENLENTSMGGMWEFPGGKQEEGESIQNTVIREIKEELGISVLVRYKLIEFDYAYKNQDIHFSVYICHLIEGEPKPIESLQIKWVNIHDLVNYRFPAANKLIISKLKDYFLIDH